MASCLSCVSGSPSGLDIECQPNVSTACCVYVASIFISPLGIKALASKQLVIGPNATITACTGKGRNSMFVHMSSALPYPHNKSPYCNKNSYCNLQFKLAPRDTRSLDRQAAKLAPKTAGKQWFDLPAQQMTDETKRDLKLLQLRGTFDPKRFYKSSDHKKGLPKFFQVGTVVSSSADFYSGVALAVTLPALSKLSHHLFAWNTGYADI